MYVIQNADGKYYNFETEQFGAISNQCLLPSEKLAENLALIISDEFCEEFSIVPVNM